MESAKVSPPNGSRLELRALAATQPRLKLVDQVRQAVRTRQYSPKTEESYVHWIKRFIFFHNKRHPAQMGEKEIGQFLSSLATDRHVSASTQNQALNAICFFTVASCEKRLDMLTVWFAQKDRIGSQWF